MSKILIVSKKKVKAQKIQEEFQTFLNLAAIYEENQKINVETFDWSKNASTQLTFAESQVENISQLLFPNKLKNLNGFPLYVAFVESFDTISVDYNSKGYNSWTFFIDIITEKLNTTSNFIQLKVDKSSSENFKKDVKNKIKNLIRDGRFDFYLNGFYGEGDLESYTHLDRCFLAPLPPKFSIYELILTLPLDKSCWLFLGITICISALVWRIFNDKNSHWDFLFVIFAFFVGQSLEIKT